MIADRLAIPLTENPARQKLWRAVGLFGMIVGAILLGYLADRTLQFRTSSQRWPATASMEIRLIKTPKTVQAISSSFSGVQALPETPWSIPEMLTWSKREFILYSDGQSIIGATVDGVIPTSDRAALAQWKWRTVDIGRRTLIIPSSSVEPLLAERNFNLWPTLPVFDGGITLKDPGHGNQVVPFRFSSPTSLDFPINAQSFISKSTLALPNETELLGHFSISADLVQALFPNNIPANFPGLHSLHRQAATQGADILLGTDEQGPAFTVAISAANLSLEELGMVATEGASLQDLSTTVSTNNLSTYTELRSANNITLELKQTDNVDSAIAKTSTGSLFRLTESPTQLIASNRPAIIGLDLAKYSDACLKNTLGFVRPKALLATFSGLNFASGHTITEAIQRAEEIAYRKKLVRICW